MPVYAIRHVTRFDYSQPVTESVMEVYMQPLSEGTARCLSFQLHLKPTVPVHHYTDCNGNQVYHFSVPEPHRQLRITAESEVEIGSIPVPPQNLPASTWHDLHVVAHTNAFWEWVQPSDFTHPTPLLYEFIKEFDLRERDDPMSLVREINGIIYDSFDYVPQSTQVDSPIDVALKSRQGVCQDYTHIMLAILRHLRIPARYVSGYLFHRGNGHADRSAQDATHAWLEVYFPELGWVGFDPTNDLIAGERHIRTAIGRDYHDVPPTRGVFKGDSESHLEVAVQVYALENMAQRVESTDTWLPITVESQAQQQQQ